MSDESDSSSNYSNWSAPSYSLSNPNSGLSFGNTTVNTGNYSLGGSGGLQGDLSGGGGFSFGNTTYTPGYTQNSPGYGFTPDSTWGGGGGYTYQAPTIDTGSLDYQKNFLQTLYNKPVGTLSNPNSVDAKINQSVMAMPDLSGTYPDANKGAFGWFQPGSTAYKWGLRDPGSAAAQDFNNYETGAERNTRMGLVSDAIGSASGLLPGMGMAKGVANAYNGYKQGQSLEDVFTNFASGMTGAPGAIAQALQGNYGNAVAKMVPGIGGAAAGLGIDALSGKDVTNPAMTLAARYAGGQVAGPIGASLGGKMMTSYLSPDKQTNATGGTNVADNSSFMDKLSTFLGGGTGQTVNGINGPVQVGQQASQQGTTQPSTGQSILAGLSTLYNGNNAASSLSNVGNSMSSQNDALLAQQAALKSQLDQMPTLAAMYGQDSPYAKQLRETLARKDAAAGRNSQYGAREVNFQAQLADKANSYAAQQAQLAAQLAQSSNATNQQISANTTAGNTAAQQLAALRAQQLAGLYNIADKSGVVDWIGSGLGSLFGGGGRQASSSPVDTSNYEWT